MKRIVCFGGGNALSKLILRPFKKNPHFEIVSINSMVDDGGSAGALKREFNTLPAGDIRRHLLALADLPKKERWKEKIWNFRFSREIEFSPQHFGHNFANIFLTALEVNYGFEKALKICHQFLKVKGKCLPATIENTTLFAELEDGKIIKGEFEIDLGQNHNRNLKIKRIFLKPKVKTYLPTLRVIKRADFIIIGPGDLYSSLLPCFLPRGMKKVLSLSRAKKIFICPAMTKLGETQGFSIRDFEREAERYMGCKLDFVIYNTGIDKRKVKRYKKDKEKEFILEPPEINNDLEPEKFIGRDLVSKEMMEYEEKKLKRVLREIMGL